jgi:hypothetical protein
LWKKYRPKSKSAARTNHQHGRVVDELIRLAFGTGVGNRPSRRVAQVDLPLDVVIPRRRVGILEVRHEHLRPAVEGVNDHLALDRPSDLHAAVLQIRRYGSDFPAGFTNESGLGKKIGQAAGIDGGLTLAAALKEPFARGSEISLKRRDETKGVRREDPIETREQRPPKIHAVEMNCA